MKCHLIAASAASLLFLANVSKSEAGILSGPIVNPSNGHIYYLLDNVPASNTPNPFDAGQAEAITLGGNLATINDAAEDAWVFDTFDLIAAGATPASNRKSLLLGLTDRDTEGTFEWINGEPLSYTNWAFGQPQSSTADEDYVGIALSTNAFIAESEWHDIDFVNDDVVYAVVEVVVPEPSTLVLVLLGSLGLGCAQRWKR